MKREFIHKDFLLESKSAAELYHRYAAPLPIIDYHCHLSPKDIADDRRFTNLTEIWLAGDHYKWRAMRTCGVNERLITGDASDEEKFMAWAGIVPKLIRNPLYHWTHLELHRPFGITDRLLHEKTAAGIWSACNAKLAKPGFTCQGILRQMNVETVCTTDDPTDSLEHHMRYAAQPGTTTRMVPAFRPDRAMAAEDVAQLLAWIRRLEHASNVEIRDLPTYLSALRNRHAFFHEQGCRVSDHGIETMYAEPYAEREAAAIFKRILRQKQLSAHELLQFKSAMLYEFAVMDHEQGWVQQFHLGALRNNNARMLRTLGPDTGFDSIGDWPVAQPLARFLSRLDSENRLTRTILYNLNPRDNELMATMLGNFQDGSVAGKIQYGSAWWFLDQLDGMTKQIEALSNMGVLSQSIGMLTDSRSFLSYPRHEYFRRLLCNILGGEMERGRIPKDIPAVGAIVADICYHNAKRYFGFTPTGKDGNGGARSPNHGSLTKKSGTRS